MRVSAPIVSNLRRPAGALALLLSSVALASCIDLNPNTEACSVTVAPTTVTVPVNGRSNVVGTAFDCKGNSIRNKRVNFSTANSSIATVAVDGSSNASVIGVSVGQTTITATSDKGSATLQVTVGAEVASSVTVAPTALTLRVGNVRPFTAQLKNAAGVVITGRTLRWTSSNSAIAAVDQSGNVTALQPGNVVINAEADGANGTASVLVTLVPVGSCSISPLTQKLTVTAQAQPTLVLRDTANGVIPAGSRPIVWSSDNEIVATVSQSGLVTTRQKGSAVITATSAETPSVNCKTTIEAVDARINSVFIQQRTGSLRIGVPVALTYQLRDSLNQVITAPRTVTWSSVNGAVASITNLGVVTGIAEGSARIVLTAEGVADTVTFPVTKIPVGRLIISPLQRTVFEGETQQFNLVVEDSAGRVVNDRVVEWISTDQLRATVNSNGLVQALAPGSVGIFATSEGRQSATAGLTIQQLPVDTIVAQPSFSLTRGTTSGFTITLRSASGAEIRNRTVQVTSLQPSIASVPQFTQTSTVQVTGNTVGTTELILQALTLTGAADGKPTRVSINVTGNGIVAPVRKP